jgi:Tfp pilus assembly protein PilF
MRGITLLAICGIAFAQSPGSGSAYETLARSYEALRAADYDAAITGFRKAIESSPERSAIRKDLAYAYLKIGENVLAREQFKAVMEMDPGDAHAALEYAFLCYETKERQQARRVFDRIRKTAAEPERSTAERAFQQIDGPLAQGIERWRQAIAAGGSTFSAHFELAYLRSQRRTQTIAHSAQPAGCEEAVVLFEWVILGGPHLMLAYVRCYYRILAHIAAYRFKYHLWKMIGRDM